MPLIFQSQYTEELRAKFCFRRNLKHNFLKHKQVIKRVHLPSFSSDTPPSVRTDPQQLRFVSPCQNRTRALCSHQCHEHIRAPLAQASSRRTPHRENRLTTAHVKRCASQTCPELSHGNTPRAPDGRNTSTSQELNKSWSRINRSWAFVQRPLPLAGHHPQLKRSHPSLLKERALVTVLH